MSELWTRFQEFVCRLSSDEINNLLLPSSNYSIYFYKLILEAKFLFNNNSLFQLTMIIQYPEAVDKRDNR